MDKNTKKVIIWMTVIVFIMLITSISIDGIQYEGVILDSCGACSYVQENRLDLFVRDKNSVIDRGYKGKNMVKVVYKWKD